MFALTDRAIFTSVLPNQPIDITCRSGKNVKFSRNTVWWSMIRNTSFNIPIFCTILIVASYLGRLQCMNYSFPSPFSHTWKLSYQASFLIWLCSQKVLHGYLGKWAPRKISKSAKLFWGIMELYWCVRYNKKSKSQMHEHMKPFSYIVVCACFAQFGKKLATGKFQYQLWPNYCNKS